MIVNVLYIIVLVLAILFSIVFGCLLGKLLLDRFSILNAKKFRRQAAGVVDIELGNEFISTGFTKKILLYLVKISYSISHVNDHPWFTKKFIKTNKLSKKLISLKQKSSLPEVYGNYALKEVQFRFAFIGFCAAAFIGSIFSYVLMLILSISGLFVGLYLPIWAMKQEKLLKTENLERCLPEMLEVVSLGLRSGLTFDRAFRIYTSHFNNDFSSSCLSAQRKWEGGICSREEALRMLSRGYDSLLLSRIIENIIRSLRFGSSLVDGLEEAAVESRNLYKSKQEEKVSKAPVKMMVPTGTLILPAMLILVLGPILLELGSGF